VAEVETNTKSAATNTRNIPRTMSPIYPSTERAPRSLRYADRFPGAKLGKHANGIPFSVKGLVRLDNYVDAHVALHDNRRIRFILPLAVGAFLCNRVECLEEIMVSATPNRCANPRRFLILFYTLSSLLLSLCVGASAEQPDRIVGTIDSSQTVVLKGTVSPKARPQYDKGPLDPSTKLTYVSLLIQPSAAQQAALKQLLAEQQDPSSPNYHKWLTPEQYGQRFGLSNVDVAKITSWLRSRGFTVGQVARGRDFIVFSGTVAQVQRTFHTELHRYNVTGEEHFANATDPSIPKALDGVVAGFRGLNNFLLQPMNVKKTESAISSDYYNGGGNYLAPGDIATIYDIGPLYSAGINGTGMALAIVGQTDIYAADIAQFRSGFGLPANVPTQILATGCTDPGVTGDLVEADIDIEWSGAVARDATIIFVKCNTSAGGVGTSAQYAVDNDVAPVISMSYGACESQFGESNALAFQTLVQKANTEGITFLASSGDSGAAGCDSSGATTAAEGLAVNLPASVPEVTAVGGTEFNEGTGNYWGTANGSNGGSALSYIPELAWDDNSTGAGFDPHLASTGGGASLYFPVPSWQTGPGVPSNSVRNVPDVALSASADHDGYVVCTNNGSCAGGVQSGQIYGGTSVSTPIFAGIVTLLNQQMKNTPPAGLGNINSTLYQFAQSMPSAFHDVPAGNYNNGGAGNPSGNTVPCQAGTPNCPATAPFQFGYKTTANYDQVTGLGSVDADVFVTNWASAVKIPTTTTVTLSPTSLNVGSSGPVSTKGSVTHATGSGTPTGSISFYVDGSPTAAGSGTLSGGSFTFSYNPSALAAGNHTISATYAGDSNFAGSTSNSATLGVQDFKIVASPPTVIVTAPGQSGTTTLTITPLGGFSQTLNYSCTGLPPEAACTFTAASATTETLTISTTAPSSRLDKNPFGRHSGIFYALLLPGFLGLALSAGNRKRRCRGIHLLSLIAVLALSTLWMPACGGSSKPSNPGTPAGTSTLTVTAAATGGTLTHPVTVTLTVQ
jgi:subtilase family serine protease